MRVYVHKRLVFFLSKRLHIVGALSRFLKIKPIYLLNGKRYCKTSYRSESGEFQTFNSNFVCKNGILNNCALLKNEKWSKHLRTFCNLSGNTNKPFSFIQARHDALIHIPHCFTYWSSVDLWALIDVQYRQYVVCTPHKWSKWISLWGAHGSMINVRKKVFRFWQRKTQSFNENTYFAKSVIKSNISNFSIFTMSVKHAFH